MVNLELQMSFTRRSVRSLVVFMLMVSSVATLARGGAEESPSQTPVLPDLKLAPIAKFASDALYLQSVSADVIELQRQAEAAQDPGTQVEFLLAAANVILAYEVEPDCTRAVLHLPPPTDAPKVEGSLENAGHLLKQSQSILDSEKGKADGLTQELRAYFSQLEQLQAFHHAIAVYLAEGQSEDDATKARQASSRLSVLLEDGDERVVAAATLWHALLRSRHSDPERAARMLPLALSRPPQKSLQFGFYARLLRCRLLAKRGSYAVALGLLSQLEEKSREWFVLGADQDNAFRAITVTTFQVLDQWRAQLGDSEEVRQRDWCVDKMQWHLDRRLEGDKRFVLRLRPAVPIIAAAPKKDVNGSADSGKDEPANNEVEKAEPDTSEAGIDGADKPAPAPDEPKKKNPEPGDDDDGQRRP